MTTATTTPIMTGVSAGAGGSVGGGSVAGAGERHTCGNRLTDTCKHRHSS